MGEISTETKQGVAVALLWTGAASIVAGALARIPVSEATDKMAETVFHRKFPDWRDRNLEVYPLQRTFGNDVNRAGFWRGGAAAEKVALAGGASEAEAAAIRTLQGSPRAVISKVLFLVGALALVGFISFAPSLFRDG